MFQNRMRWAIGLALMWAVSFSSAAFAQQSPRERTSINFGWKFTKGDPEGTGDKLAYANIKNWMLATGQNLIVDKDAPRNARPAGNIGEDVAYTRADFNDSQWRSLNLPHDWGVEGPFEITGDGATGKLPFYGIAWYRKALEIPASDQGKRIYLDMDGSMSYTNVWCNGQYAGGWGYGYTSFRIDLTAYIRPGQANVLAIRLDNPPVSSRWYPGGGIHRNVWLTKTSTVHVSQWGSHVTTPQITPSSATVDIKTSVDNKTSIPYDVAVRTEIFEYDASNQRGRSVGSTPQVLVSLPPNEPGEVSAQMTLPNPKLWDTQSPNRYVAVTTLQIDGRLVDVYETPFGVRSVRFDANTGFFLNGVATQFKGVCNHSDLGALGTAVSYRGLERQVEILKAMGTNAIRTAHNPPPPELLEIADREGILIIDETFDCWRAGKRTNDYHLLFDEWSERDTRALIRRDRNHPSIVLWSIGNEVGEFRNPAAFNVGVRLARITKEEDPTRLVTAACQEDSFGYDGFQNVVDVFGYNYLRGRNLEEQLTMYKRFHAANPLKYVMSTESASTISTRGEYAFPAMDQFYNKSGGAIPDQPQMSSYDLYAPPWAQPPDWEWKAQETSGFVVGGEFVWTGFDYLGEPTRNFAGGARGGRGIGPATGQARGPATGPATAPVARGGARGRGFAGPPNPSRSSYFGIIDLAGFPKDRYYIYQSRWRPDLKMAHILPHWNWPGREGQITPVHVYTSGDEGELFINGKSQGRRKKGEKGLVTLAPPPEGARGGGFGAIGIVKIDDYRLAWDEVVYEPGEVKVVTYKAGQPWAEATMKTTGPASKVAIKPDRPTIVADGVDLSFVTVSVADASGAMVPRSMNLLKFEVTGPGEIVAVDNGDPASLEPFHASQMKAFNGLCLVIVRTKPGQAGDIKLRAISDGLAAGEATISGVLRR